MGIDMELKKLKTKDFNFEYSQDLEDYVKEVEQISLQRKEVLCKFFKCNFNDIPAIDTAILSNQKDFVDYIHKITNNKSTPPEWATGCFCNDGIQMLVLKDNPKQYNASKFIISHEMTHLFINKFVYNKYNIPRLKWWDECYAYWLERPLTKERAEQAITLSKENEHRANFDMNIIKNDSKNENEVNAFPLYKIVGYYIFQNNLAKKYVEIIKKDRNKMVEIGKTIVADAIDYILDNTNTAVSINKNN